MKYIKSFAASMVLASAMLATSCDPSDFGDINETPNSPTKSFTYMMFKDAAMYTRNFIMTSSSFDPWPAEWSGYLSEAKNDQYGGLDATSTYSASTYYTRVIRGLNSIIEANQDPAQNTTTAVTAFGSNENQIGVCMTLRSYFFMNITDILGPIVYTQAYQVYGDNPIWEPAYDTQKEVYAALDKDLCDAYAMMDEKGSLSSSHDIFFQGNVSKWKKLNASIRMMLAIKLADVDPAEGKARFAKAYADGAMTDAADSFTYTFTTNATSWFYSIGCKDAASQNVYFAPNKVLVDALKEYQDPRLFTYATVGVSRYAYLGSVAGATDEYDFNAYKGIPSGLSGNSTVGRAKVGACSTAPKYCEPQATYGLITAARTLLCEAEAATLGWIDPSKASELYEAGIKASFDFEAKSDGAWGGKFKAADYIAAHPLPQDKDAALKEIAMQRFLAGFLTDGIQAWADWRRCNVPTMPIYDKPASLGHYTYPNRLAFGSSDYSTNGDNLEVALKDLSNGVDDPWSRVWWDVADNECPVIKWTE